MAKDNSTKSRDLILLRNIRSEQNLLRDGMKRHDIKIASDLRKDPLVRKGVIFSVAIIFVHAKSLRDVTYARLPWSADLIKNFRNTAVHRYGVLNDVMALAYIKHCLRKELIAEIDVIISELEEDV